MNYLRLIVLLIVSAVGVGVRAQSDTVISLVTCYPGTEIYELEGHSAIRVRFPGTDVAASWGMFNFNAPNFVYRFVKGETDYMVGLVPWNYFEQSYRHSNRRVEEQVLKLTSEQKRRAIALIEENLRPENRVYRYNYVKDNCATRPLAIIEGAVGDSLHLGPTLFDTWSRPTSFRDVMRYYHRNYSWYQFGIDIALGSGIDYALPSREYAFAPVLLEEQMAGATLNGQKIAQPAQVIVDLPKDAAVLGPTPWYLSPMFVCWLVFFILLAFTIRDIRRKKVTKAVDAVYFGIMGLAGLLLTFLIFVSVHEATSPNWLYFWLNPFCLIPCIFIWLKRCKNVVMSYQICNFAVVLVLLIAWWWIPQSANAAFLPLVLGDLLRSGSYIVVTFKQLKQR